MSRDFRATPNTTARALSLRFGPPLLGRGANARRVALVTERRQPARSAHSDANDVAPFR